MIRKVKTDNGKYYRISEVSGRYRVILEKSWPSSDVEIATTSSLEDALACVKLDSGSKKLDLT